MPLVIASRHGAAENVLSVTGADGVEQTVNIHGVHKHRDSHRVCIAPKSPHPTSCLLRHRMSPSMARQVNPCKQIATTIRPKDVTDHRLRLSEKSSLPWFLFISLISAGALDSRARRSFYRLSRSFSVTSTHSTAAHFCIKHPSFKAMLFAGRIWHFFSVSVA